MTSRERVNASLNHVQPDKIAVDFCGHACSGMHVDVLARLREYYGLEKKPITVWDAYLMIGEMDDDLRDIIGVDTYPAMGPGVLLGMNRYPLKKWTTLQGQEVLVPQDFVTTPDGKGGLYAYPCGDLSAGPSAHMPANGLYFDAIIRQDPIDEDNMNPDDNLQEFGVLTDADLQFIVDQVDKAYASGKAVVMNMPGLGYGDAGLLPGEGLRHPKGIRDIAEWYMAPLLYPDYVNEVFTRQNKIALTNLKLINDACGDRIDVAIGCMTDFAHQTGLMTSLEVFRELYLPHYQEVNGWIHKNTRWKTMKHCCGAVRDLLPLLIEAGFDSINPVQCSAVGMEPQALKNDFGKQLTFWGGAVDTQQLLPHGTPEQVRRQVLERCEIFGRDGGFICNPIHNVQADVPTENIVAFIDAVKEFNGEK